jgi:hypothetical protein
VGIPDSWFRDWAKGRDIRDLRDRKSRTDTPATFQSRGHVPIPRHRTREPASALAATFQSRGTGPVETSQPAHEILGLRKRRDVSGGAPPAPRASRDRGTTRPARQGGIPLAQGVNPGTAGTLPIPQPRQGRQVNADACPPPGIGSGGVPPVEVRGTVVASKRRHAVSVAPGLRERAVTSLRVRCRGPGRGCVLQPLIN